MAARQQHRGTGSGIQYEDLVPKSEWKDQPEATLLTIDLPGFEKEHIKVTYVHTSKMIRVTGERPLDNRRWSRFNEVFSVPQNCLVDKIHGSLKNNVLTITLPKETITKMTNLPDTSKTVAEKVEKLEEKRLLEEYKRKKEEEEAEKKKKKLLEEKEELIRKLQEEAKAREMAEAKKLQEEQARAKEMAEAKKFLEEAEEMKKKLLEKKEELIKKKLKQEEMVEAKKLQEEAKAKEKLEEEATLEEKKKIQKQEERKLPEVVYTKPGIGTGIKTGSEKVGEVVKTTKEKLGYVVEKEKRMGKGIIEKIRKNEMTSEEKKLMVNVGMAALVIFALGAYVSYTFCCSSSSSSSSPSSSSSSTKPE
ncbi:hypothetical protein AALP_AA8G043200 [Arabis alpina]|uniref:SHSP domain-containing protein n=1 Tax=Arabis alpina TaxID=50452 RepID=A0A087G4X6_ARAAL|nr:hypothetical protein AALP_AA8G043200 [Arabis alpina]